MTSAERMSINALRVELARRGLSTEGLKDDLQARLAEVLAQQKSPITVPSRFYSKKDAIRDSEAIQKPSSKRPRADTTKVDQQSPVEKQRRIQVVGHYVGRAVWVMGAENMTAIWTISDAYGKGNLSRSAPTYATAIDASSTRGRAARQLLALEKAAQKQSGSDVGRAHVEHLQLTLVEAYHATFVAKRMRIATTWGESMDDPAKVWHTFAKQLPHFPAAFAAYSKYRATGWMPRSGLKYGVDWVLYPLGSHKHSHAPYCVIVCHADSENPSPLESTWVRLQNKLRLVKNVAKSLIVAEVCFAEDVLPTCSQEAIEKVRISEVTVDRWIP